MITTKPSVETLGRKTTKPKFLPEVEPVSLFRLTVDQYADFGLAGSPCFMIGFSSTPPLFETGAATPPHVLKPLFPIPSPAPVLRLIPRAFFIHHPASTSTEASKLP